MAKPAPQPAALPELPTIPRYLAEEWGEQRLRAISAQIIETIEAERGGKWAWELGYDDMIYRPVRVGTVGGGSVE